MFFLIFMFESSSASYNFSILVADALNQILIKRRMLSKQITRKE